MARRGPALTGPGPGSDDGAERVFLAPGVWLPVGEVTWRFSTAGGPGGQHVNTSNTRAEATFDVERSAGLPGWARERLVARLGPVVSAAAGDTRSQARNRDLALARLVARMSGALEVRRLRRPTRPTAASQRRRVDQKRRRGQLKSERRSRNRPEGD